MQQLSTMDNSLPALLSILTTSLDSALTVLPDETTILPPKEGISLLDVKNELLLSYLQNLVFLIVLKLRSQFKHSTSENQSEDEPLDIQDEVVKKLVELRVYLEKGVRPLEGRLKYQIDKVIRAADDAARSAVQTSSDHRQRPSHAQKQAHNEDSEDSEVDHTEEESSGSVSPDEEINELSFRPNPAAFIRPKQLAAKSTTDDSTNDGIYKPPRITPTALPIIRGREERDARRPTKSATLDEFIATELSTAPMAEPSIGSTIVSGGRHTKSQREREEEAERQTYEEANFVRLPKESKKERAQKGHRSRDGGYGGEEWRMLGAGLDRIETLTQKKGGASGALERSRKRPIQDGPRGTGAEFGERFEKRRKMQSRTRRR
ncbi:U3 small nucleolar ribonucleo protein LCP5 [Glonium stellatum]|uniref:U3 small nucleolar ribonucleo protein LCP5 n=1 Tax=Glonium stellatum TaxID=574774 RepID=A0A8E2F7I0_9PEZI|nr:U3 small nucleolar ribonucleo protein LCP5 [Glonium stellatum]